MRILALVILSTLVLFSSLVVAQKEYSESTPYTPRTEPKKKKKKSEQKAVMMVPPVTGDQTITIPISVFDKSGTAVGGLTRDNMSVLVDGVSTPIASFEQAAEPPNIILVLDTSVSAQKQAKPMREQAWALVQAFPSSTRFMLIDFDHEMKIRTQLTDNRSDIQAALAKPKGKGSGTSIYTVMHDLYRQVLPKIPGRKAIILMTDGVDTTSTNSYYESMAEIEKEGVPVYPIYFDTFEDTQPSKLPTNELERMIEELMRSQGRRTRFGMTVQEYKLGLVYINDLAAASGGRIFSSQKLEAGTKSLIDELTSKYFATITVPRKTPGLSRPLRVRVDRPGVAVFARGSFID